MLVEDGRVALIERVREGKTYYLFPGGGVEAGETPEQAAVREAHEELGVDVELDAVAYDEEFGGVWFVYFAARIVGGEFGTGLWPDHADRDALAREKSGTHEPTWIEIDELAALDVRPRVLAEHLADELVRSRTVPLLAARPLRPEERALTEFLARAPRATRELGAQLASARVVAQCLCGCASVQVDSDEAAADTDVSTLHAEGKSADGMHVDVNLHVDGGRIFELEIWTGRFGFRRYPEPDTLAYVDWDAEGADTIH